MASRRMSFIVRFIVRPSFIAPSATSFNPPLDVFTLASGAASIRTWMSPGSPKLTSYTGGGHPCLLHSSNTLRMPRPHVSPCQCTAKPLAFPRAPFITATILHASRPKAQRQGRHLVRYKQRYSNAVPLKNSGAQNLVTSDKTNPLPLRSRQLCLAQSSRSTQSSQLPLTANC